MYNYISCTEYVKLYTINPCMQYLYIGPPNQPITKADSEPFNGQGTEVATNHTGKSTHSEGDKTSGKKRLCTCTFYPRLHAPEFRTETHEISKKTDPDPEIENPKPGTFIYTYHDQAIQNNINLYNVMQQITKKGRAKLLELYKANDQISYV